MKRNCYEDILARTKPEGDCIVWLGERIWNGYGRVGFGSKRQLVHRVVFEHEYGPIPDGMLVCHSCDNRPCCNPAHLFLGTHAENSQDASRKGRVFRPLGERAPAAKLLETDIPKIRRLHAAGVSYRTIGDAFGVTPDCIGKIATGKNWSHVR